MERPRDFYYNFIHILGYRIQCAFSTELASTSLLMIDKTMMMTCIKVWMEIRHHLAQSQQSIPQKNGSTAFLQECEQFA
jgi:hypothetical protein